MNQASLYALLAFVAISALGACDSTSNSGHRSPQTTENKEESPQEPQTPDTAQEANDATPDPPQDQAQPEEDPTDPHTRAYWDAVLRECTTCGNPLPPQTMDRMVTLETIVRTERMDMSTMVQVQCMPMDAQGQALEDLEIDTEVLTSPPSSMLALEPGTWQAVQPGAVSITCTLPAMGMRDRTPALLQIRAGLAHTITTSLDRHSVQAGQDVHVTCAAQDLLGNHADSTGATIMVSPTGAGIHVDGRTLRITEAGDFTVSCILEGTQEAFAEPLQVRPGDTHTLTVSSQESQDLYHVGDVAQFSFAAHDLWQNPLPDPTVSISSDLYAVQRGCCNLELLQAGLHTLTFHSQGVTQTQQVFVDDGAPMITCGSPQQGRTLYRRQGQRTFTIQGNAQDNSGIASVKVNGRRAAYQTQSGLWSYNLPSPQDGVLAARVEATDNNGTTSHTFCSWIVSSQSPLPSGEELEDAARIHVGQQLFDDGDRQGAPNSASDLVEHVLNQQAFANKIREQVSQNGVLIPRHCRVDTYFFGCALKAGVNLDGLSVQRADVSMNTQEDILNVHVTLNNLSIDLRARGHVLGISYNTPGEVRMDAALDMSFNINLINGVPVLRLRHTGLALGDFHVDFDDWSIVGQIIDGGFSIVLQILDAIPQHIRRYLGPTFEDRIGKQITATIGSIHLPSVDLPQQAPGVMMRLADLDLTHQGLTITLASSVSHATTQFTQEGVNTPTQGLHTVVKDTMINQHLAALWRSDAMGLRDHHLREPIAIPGQGNILLDADLTVHQAPIVRILSNPQSAQLELHMRGVQVTTRQGYNVSGVAVPAGTTFAAAAIMRAAVSLNEEGHLVIDNLTIEDFNFGPRGALQIDPPFLTLAQIAVQQSLEAKLRLALQDYPLALPMPTWSTNTKQARDLNIPSGTLAVIPLDLTSSEGFLHIHTDVTFKPTP